MNLNKIGAVLTNKASRSVLVVKKFSPEILVGVGIVGLIGSTVMDCNATLKVDAVLAVAKGARTRRDKNKSYVSYSSYSRGERERGAPDRAAVNRARHNFDEIILETRGDAEEVLSHLVDLTEDYGQATIADLYSLVGMTSAFTDDKYGWTNLSTASVSRVREGYLINLPKAILVD